MGYGCLVPKLARYASERRDAAGGRSKRAPARRSRSKCVMRRCLAGQRACRFEIAALLAITSQGWLGACAPDTSVSFEAMPADVLPGGLPVASAGSAPTPTPDAPSVALPGLGGSAPVASGGGPASSAGAAPTTPALGGGGGEAGTPTLPSAGTGGAGGAIETPATAGSAGAASEQICTGIATCQSACPAGGCKTFCAGNSNCVASCTGGGCETDCAGEAVCNMNCQGGGCRLRCSENANCTFVCPGGGCTFSCRGKGACNVDCGGHDDCKRSD